MKLRRFVHQTAAPARPRAYFVRFPPRINFSHPALLKFRHRRFSSQNFSCSTSPLFLILPANPRGALARKILPNGNAKSLAPILKLK
jgi:hypothetical protein